MRSKYRIIFLLGGVGLLATIIFSLYSYWMRNYDYSERIIGLLEEKSYTTVADVFDFAFERAYVFNDCYISGDGFSERYGLELSISEVGTGVSESIQRVVFVDAEGNFVYEYCCDNNELVITEEGVVIYPDTIITRSISAQERPIQIHFESVEFYST